MKMLHEAVFISALLIEILKNSFADHYFYFFIFCKHMQN